jgi:hypothetical protein
LRADVARLHAAHTAVHIRHGWMRLLFKDLSTNPYTQYQVHMWGAIYWLINFPLICCLFFFTPTLWLKLGIFITLIYSIYANLRCECLVQRCVDVAGLRLQVVAGLLPCGDERIRVRCGHLERIDQDYCLGHKPKLAD